MGEILKQPWATRSLVVRLRDVAHMTDAIQASSAVVDAAMVAGDEESESLFAHPKNAHHVRHIRDLAVSLDEAVLRFVVDLSLALRLPLQQVSDRLAAVNG